MALSEKQYLFKLCVGLPTLYDWAGYPKTIFYGSSSNPSSAAIIPARSDPEGTEILTWISELDEIWLELYNAQKASHISMAKWYEDTANNCYHSRFITYLNKNSSCLLPLVRQCRYLEKCVYSREGFLMLGGLHLHPLNGFGCLVDIILELQNIRVIPLYHWWKNDFPVCFYRTVSTALFRSNSSRELEWPAYRTWVL